MLSEKILGPDIALDETQQFVLGVYWDLRRQSSQEQGIAVPDDADPILSSHLYALDRVFLEHRNEVIAEARRKANARGAPKRTRH